jgi:hypothetical protein
MFYNYTAGQVVHKMINFKACEMSDDFRFSDDYLFLILIFLKIQNI